jgi:hypothetical protein
MENRVKDLIRFYLQKHVRETCFYLERCMDLYCFYLKKTCLTDIRKLILNKFLENIHGENTPLMRALFYYEPTTT